MALRLGGDGHGIGVRFKVEIQMHNKKDTWEYESRNFELLSGLQHLIRVPDAPDDGESGDRDKPADVHDYTFAPDSDATRINLLKKFVSRLIRNARTGKPHSYLPELVTEAGKLGLEAVSGR